MSLDLRSRVQSTNINHAVQAYNSSLSNLFNEECPLKEINVTFYKKQKWFNGDLRQMKRSVRQAERNYRKDGSSIHHDQLANIRNLYRTCMNQTREVFFSDLFDQISDDIGLVYKTANYLLSFL